MSRKYIVIQWPEIQYYMDKEGFKEHSYLINDEKGIDDFGSSAYFVEESWIKDLSIPEHKVGEKFEYNGELYECIALPDLGKTLYECEECAFYDLCDPNDLNHILPIIGECMFYNRDDGKEVIFKKVE